MTRLEPLTREALPQYEEIFKAMDDSIGYVPNSFFTMARDPLLMRAVSAMTDAAWYPKTVSEPLRRLVTFAFSQFCGVGYSAAHCACGAPELGLPLEKILAIHDYETSPLYTDAERAVLRLCRHAARIPSEVTDRDVDALHEHFDTAQVMFIATLICYMAFLNKWNDLFATTLEPVPEAFARKHLGPVGWRSSAPDAA